MCAMGLWERRWWVEVTRREQGVGARERYVAGFMQVSIPGLTAWMQAASWV